eukprot:1020409-Amphidinium_carterae.1
MPAGGGALDVVAGGGFAVAAPGGAFPAFICSCCLFCCSSGDIVGPAFAGGPFGFGIVSGPLFSVTGSLGLASVEGGFSAARPRDEGSSGSDSALWGSLAGSVELLPGVGGGVAPSSTRGPGWNTPPANLFFSFSNKLGSFVTASLAIRFSENRLFTPVSPQL